MEELKGRDFIVNCNRYCDCLFPRRIAFPAIRKHTSLQMSIKVFDVFKLVTISKNKITAIAADTTHIYISCKDGKLMVFEMKNRRERGAVVRSSCRPAIRGAAVDSPVFRSQEGSHHDAVRLQVEPPLFAE